MSCSKDDDNTKPNTPPAAFSLIAVTDKATNVERLPDFSWEAATDADGDTVTYDLYLDTQANPTTLYAGNIKDTHFKITELLDGITQYYWKVIAKDDNKGATESKIFSFTTTPNTPPSAFSLTEVEDNAIDVDVLPRFYWEAATDADGDTVTYDLYLGTEENLTTVLEENIEDTFQRVYEALSLGTKYYWKIIAKDSHGDSRESETFSFTTVTNTRFPKTSKHTSVIFDNKIWVIAGYPSVGAWYSADGLNWTQTIGQNDDPADDRNGHTSVVFKDKMWIIGGDNKNDVWSSIDGITWVQVTEHAAFSAREHHTSVVFDNKIWVIGGRYDNNGEEKNDVWYSEDGLTWIEATNKAAFSERSFHTSLVFNNKMWVISGHPYLSDVWYSEDGITWTEATNDASWESRSGATSLVFNNKMWLIGGQDYDSKNDVWSSTDGIIWTEAIGVAPSSEKIRSSSVIFNNKMWIIGGVGLTGDGQNDVWMSTDGANWVESK